jgi:hypothetical protein
MAIVHAKFDCSHEVDVDVSIDEDVEVPPIVRGLGKCADCSGEENLVPVSGVAPQPGGDHLIVDSIMLIPV